MYYNHLVFFLLFASIYVFLFPLFPKERSWARTTVMGISLFLLVRYAIWRFTNTVLVISPMSLAGAWIWGFFGMELLVLLEFAIFLFIISGRSNRSPEADQYEKQLRNTPDAQLPPVDVLIPTYDESLEVLEKSIIGAQNLNYPNFTVWVLDDGNRDWLEEYCSEQSVKYISREDNKHFKAGNMNNALQYLEGKYIASFDADFVPKQNFLYRTVGFLDHNDDIGILQTPQNYFNPDTVQANLHLSGSWPDDQRFFYSVVLPSKDAWDVATCCGSCSLHRRSAVEDVGGYPTDTTLEDFPMTLKLKAQGWITRYLNESLSLGLAPENTNALKIQRSRWMRGGLQTMFVDYGPFGSGHSLKDRIMFFPLFWLNLIPFMLAILVAPVLYLWFATPPFILPGMLESLSYQGTWLFALFGTLLWRAPQEYRIFPWSATALYLGINLTLTWIATMIDPFGKYLGKISGGFDVTPKNPDRIQVDYFTITVSSLFLFLIMFGLFINGFPAYAPLLESGRGYQFLPFMLFWGLFMIIQLGLCIMMSFDFPNQRGEVRFDLNEQYPCVIEQNEHVMSQFRDISLSGAKMLLERDVQIPDTFQIKLPCAGRITCQKIEQRQKLVRLRFIDISAEKREQLIVFLFTQYVAEPKKTQRVQYGTLLKAMLWRIMGPDRR